MKNDKRNLKARTPEETKAPGSEADVSTAFLPELMGELVNWYSS